MSEAFLKMLPNLTKNSKTVDVDTQLFAMMKVLFLWLCLIVSFVLFANFIQQNKQKPIVIDATGLSAVERAQISEALALFQDVSFFEADLNAIGQALNDISWVKEARVMRDWRQGIVVEVDARQAVANFGSEHLVDAQGVVYVPADKTTLDNPALVKLYGNQHDSFDMMKKMHQLNQWFAPLNLSVEDMVLTPRHTWLIRFDSGLRVSVDFANVDKKLFYLSEVLKDNHLPVPIDDIVAIDLRYKNGFSITPKQSLTKQSLPKPAS